MDARELGMLGYDAVHEGFVAELLSGLDDAAVRRRPHRVNSVAWRW